MHLYDILVKKKTFKWNVVTVQGVSFMFPYITFTWKYRPRKINDRKLVTLSKSTSFAFDSKMKRLNISPKGCKDVCSDTIAMFLTRDHDAKT